VASTRTRVISAIVASATALVGGVVAVSGTAQADQTAPVTTPYVRAYPGTPTGGDPTVTAMAKGPGGRPWFVTADGRAGYVTATGTMQYVSVAPGEELDGLVAASDGSLWTSDAASGTAYRISGSGVVSSFVLGIDPVAVVAKSDGSVWYLDQDSPTVVRVSSSGATTTFADTGTDSSAPTKGGSGPESMVVGADGSVWFAPSDQPVIERVTSSGTTRFALDGVATTLTLGSDGNIWAGLAAGGVDRVTSAGARTVFAPSGTAGAVLSAVTGSDGRTWVAEQLSGGSADVAAISTSGTWTRYWIPGNTTTLPMQLTAASDGSIWFAQYRVSGSGADVASRITTAGNVTTESLTNPVYALAATSAGVWFGDSAGTVTIASMPTVDRISGPSRYDTSVALAQSVYGGTTGGTVYIATGTNYPDALAAGPAAAKRGGPLLLTAPTSLPDVVAQELRALAPSKVYIVGGTSAVSDGVAAEIQNIVGNGAAVWRRAGSDRFDTARILDQDAFSGGVTSAYIATGTNYPDALAAAAAAGAAKVPVVLVNGGAASVDQSTVSFLSSLGVKNVTIVGGTSAVSGGIASGLSRQGFGVTRIAGADRFGTAAQIAASAFPSGSARAYVATGTAFPDALAGSAVAASQNAPLLTTQGSCFSASTLQELAQLGASSVTVIGGTSAVSASTAALQACS
jgi:putative cell wall-binding protein